MSVSIDSPDKNKRSSKNGRHSAEIVREDVATTGQAPMVTQRVMGALKKAAFAVVGAAVLAREETEAFVDRLIATGERVQRERDSKVPVVTASARKLLGRVGLSTRAELDELVRKLEALEGRPAKA